MTPSQIATAIIERFFIIKPCDRKVTDELKAVIVQEIEKGTAVEVVKEKTRGELVAEKMCANGNWVRGKQVAEAIDSEITDATTRERDRITAILNVGRAKEDHYLWIAAIDFALRVVEAGGKVEK